MSTRTIIEINHDALAQAKLTVDEVIAALPSHGLRELRQITEGSTGVRILAQRHHSDDLFVRVGRFEPSKEAIKTFEHEGGKFSYTAWQAMIRQMNKDGS